MSAEVAVTGRPAPAVQNAAQDQDAVPQAAANQPSSASKKKKKKVRLARSCLQHYRSACGRVASRLDTAHAVLLVQQSAEQLLDIRSRCPGSSSAAMRGRVLGKVSSCLAQQLTRLLPCSAGELCAALCYLLERAHATAACAQLGQVLTRSGRAIITCLACSCIVVVCRLVIPT